MARHLWALLFPILLGASSSTAQVGPTPQNMLKRMDRDGDGRIDRTEWLGNPGVFDRIDGDHDGVLTRRELEAWSERRGNSAGDPSGEGTGKRSAPGRRGAGPDGGPSAGSDPAATGHGVCPPGDGLTWIDTHVHVPGGHGKVEDVPGAVRDAADVMEGSHICRIILMPTPQVAGRNRLKPLEDFLSLARGYPDRFVVMGGGGSLNPMIHDESPGGSVGDALKGRFVERADAIIELGAIGFGEVAVLHLAAYDGQSFENAAGDHPLFLVLADVTARHDVVVDVHFDLVLEDMDTPAWLPQPANPPRLKRNVEGFERFLRRNRKARIVWAHLGSDFVGFRTPAQARRMLHDHPNLYMSLRLGPGRVPSNHPMGQDGIKDDWMQLFREFPDRFVIGTDQIFTPGAGGALTAQHAKQRRVVRDRTNLFLSYLPPDLARKIAHENAIRIYKIRR